MEEKQQPAFSLLDTALNRPDVRAAIVVAIPVILLELLTDLIPVLGLLAALPISACLYLMQGMLVSRYMKEAPASMVAEPGGVYALAARSAVWTGLVISPATALAATLVGGTLTAGLLFAWAPGILAGSLVDFLLNLGLAMLGGWIGSRRSGHPSTGRSCFGVGLGILLIWILVAAATVAAILYGIQFLPHGGL